MSEISLCMIVKNEEKKLKACLESAKDLYDELIIVDTGSTDNTVNIAKEFNAKIYFYEWDDDFSAARNESLKYATKDWILIMDADDILDNKSHSIIKKAIENDNVIAYLLNIYLYLGKDDNTTNYSIAKLINLFRNNLGIKYHGIVHNQIFESISKICNLNPKWKIEVLEDVIIHHFGYTEETFNDQKKFDRSVRMLNKALSKNNLTLEQKLYYKMNLAEVYRKFEFIQESKNLFIEVLNKLEIENNKHLFSQPVNTILFKGLTEIYMKEKDYISALNLIIKAINIFPDTPLFYYYLGNIYTKTNDFEKAEFNFEKCLSFKEAKNCNPFIAFNSYMLNSLPYFGLGVCYFKNKNIPKAIEYFKKSLYYNKNFEPAKQVLNLISK